MDYQIVFYRAPTKRITPSIQWDADEFNPEFPSGVSFDKVPASQSVIDEAVALVQEYATARETMADKYAIRHIRNIVEDKIYKLAATIK